jgi:hypothetical protein
LRKFFYVSGTGGPTSQAVDGNPNTQWSAGSYSHTAGWVEEGIFMTDPWWRVNFGRRVRVTGLRVYNRGDVVQLFGHIARAQRVRRR